MTFISTTKPPYEPAIPLLGIYPEETKIKKDTCIPLLTTALFTITRTWKQPRYPLTDEWIKTLWWYTVKYYSVIKKEHIESILESVTLESVTSNEVDETRTYYTE